MYIGVEGGDKNLFELINDVFNEVNEIEKLSDEAQIEDQNADFKIEATDKNLDETQEIIRELKEKLEKLYNSTTSEGPEALQDAFDRSEKFNTKSSELKEILGQVKQILKDYEENLINAKLLTGIAIEKFAKVSLQSDETVKLQILVDDKLNEIDDLKMSEDELNTLKKLVRDALEQTRAVYDNAFDLLNEVSAFELQNKLDDINNKVEQLNKHSDLTEMNVKKFVDENSEFLDEMEKTIEAAEAVEEKAFKLQSEINMLLKTITDIHKDAKKSIFDKDSILENARNIVNSLEDFTLKVEKSRESARMALEKIPEILQKIENSVKIVEKLENKLDNQTKMATDAKEKCSTAKEQMDEILSESEEIKSNIEQLENDFEELPADVASSDKETMKIFDEVEKLEKSEVEDGKLIESAKEKIDKTKSLAQETDKKLDNVIESVQELMDGIVKIKDIDPETLHNFGKKKQILKNNFTILKTFHLQKSN